MKLEIKLKESEQCIGCPVLNEDEDFCSLYNEHLVTTILSFSPLRTKKCIEENGG